MFERILHGCQSLRSIFAAACRLIPKSVSPAHGLSDGEFVMNLAEAFYPMQGARAADIEIGKNYLRESPHRRWVFADAGMRAYSERMQAPQLDDHPLHFYMPGVDAVVTPEKWRERARQVAERSSESSRTGASSNIKPDFKHSGDYVVSVITSLYKGGRFIQRFLENMTEQTIFDRSELIIVDADSPEGEREMIERYMKAFDNIVYKRINHRIGIYEAWNIAVEMSRGRYLTNANLDDLRRPDSIELQAAALDAHAFADVVYQDFYVTFDPSLSFDAVARFGFKSDLPILTPHNHLLFNSPHNAPMWRKNLHRELGLFDTSLVSAGDYEFWLRCIAAGKRFFKLNAPHVVYYVNPEGMSTKADSRGLVEGRVLFRKYCRKLLQPHLLMSRRQFAERLGVEPDWSWSTIYYDVVQRELTAFGKLHRQQRNGPRCKLSGAAEAQGVPQ